MQQLPIAIETEQALLSTHRQSNNAHGSCRAMEVELWIDSQTCKDYIDTALLELARMSILLRLIVSKSAAAFTILMQDERQARGV